MSRLAVLVLLAILSPHLMVFAATQRPAALVRGTQTGLKLPRFGSIKASVANLRRGPGLRYPIEWVYHHRDLPVKITREFGDWRHLQMPDGTRGWMHRALLSRRRTFIIVAPRTMLRGSPSDTAAPVARLQRGVTGKVRHCALNSRWCEVEAKGFSGFTHRADIWGGTTSPQ